MRVYDRQNESNWTPEQKRWLVRWRDGDGRQRKQAFAYKAEAEGFLRKLNAAPKLRDQGRTVEEQWRVWRSIRDRESLGHQANLDGLWSNHLRDEWGERRISTLTHSEVAAWVTRLELRKSPATARKALGVLSSLCDLAIRDDVLDRNPCDGLEVEVKKKHQQVILTREQLDSVAAAMGPDAVVVRVLGLVGVRWGEMVGLQVRDLDAKRRRITVRRHVTEVGGTQRIIEGTKMDDGRTITAPADLLEELQTLAKGRRASDPLLPAADGVSLRKHSQFRSRWNRVVQREGGLHPGMRIHDLRHTAASLMLASGADAKTVQRQMGHASAVMTMDLYAHLLDTSLDALSERMAKK